MQKTLIIIGAGLSGIILIISGLFLKSHFYDANAVTVDNVHVVVIQQNINNQTRQIIYDQQINGDAQKIWDQLTSGEQITSEHHPSCPSTPTQVSYYHYNFEFYHQGNHVASAEDDARNCAFVLLTYPNGETHKYTWETSKGVSLWAVLHQIDNVPLPVNICIDPNILTC